MNYAEVLGESARKTGSIVCMGLDPVVEAMPEKYRIGESEREEIIGFPKFLEALIREMKRQQVFPGAFKPNQGFYLKYDSPELNEFKGSKALDDVFAILTREFPDIPIILDYKRGDIAKSSANYATEGFGVWDADAVTISPYMGTDSVGPFIDGGRGVYILNRTSNPGAADFQNLRVIGDVVALIANLHHFHATGEEPASLENLPPANLSEIYQAIIADNTEPLYIAVAEKIVEWSETYGTHGVGAVVGATSLEELSDLVSFYSDYSIPLLIPGVGGQGGKADEVVGVLRAAKYDLGLVRINSSSGLTHPWAKKKELPPADFAEVCVRELKNLNEQIGFNP